MASPPCIFKRTQETFSRSECEIYGDTLAILHFFNPPQDGSKPFFRVTHASGAGEKNYTHNPVPVMIRDIRHQEKLFSLDTHSFAAIPGCHPPTVHYEDKEDVENQYSQDAARLLLQYAKGAQRVVVFDTTVRRALPEEKLCRPVRKVHIDQTPNAVLRRVKEHLSPFETDAMAKGDLRVRLINVWRPIIDKVTDHPLAVAESHTVEDADLVNVEHFYPDVTGETYAVKYNPTQRFWYWSQMSTSDVLLLQCFDSLKQPDGSAQWRRVRCAHASFTPLAPISLSAVNSDNF